MAYQVGASCYSSAESAVAAIASSQVGAVVEHGGAAYVVDVASVGASSVTYSLKPVSGGSAVVVTSPVSVQPCGLLDWQDGLTLGWAIAAAWIATAVVMNLRQAAHQ